MCKTQNAPGRWRPIAVSISFVVLLALLTKGLLSPIPQRAIESVGGDDRSFWLGKTIHIGGYALLAFLAAQLPLPRTWRIGITMLLIAHGAGTEYLQQFVGRGSSLRDVALDALGVALGGLLGFWLRRAGRRAKSPQINPERDRGQ